MNNYEDIINLPRHISKTRKPMTLYNRAVQFAPFAALTGYGDAIKETSRLTNKKIEIDPGLRNILNNKLNIINNNVDKKYEIEFTYFVNDTKKIGGKYEKYKGIVRRIDEVNKIIYMEDKTKLYFNDILNITSEHLNFED